MRGTHASWSSGRESRPNAATTRNAPVQSEATGPAAYTRLQPARFPKPASPIMTPEVAKHANGDSEEEVAFHVGAALAEKVDSPLLAELPAY